MPSAIYPAFIFTVVLLFTTAYFLLGGLPLLILKHDVPLDARFIRGLFDVYYKAVLVTAAAGLLANAIAGRAALAIGMAAIALIALWSRRSILARMDQLRAVMTATDAARIRQFRMLHTWGMVLNVTQLAAVCVGLVKAL